MTVLGGIEAFGGVPTLDRLRRPGPAARRVLLIGDRGCVGAPGGIAARMADRLWLTSRRGLDVDVLSDVVQVLRAVGAGFAARRLDRYDAVVVLLPVAGRRAPGLLDRVLERIAAVTRVLVVMSDTASHGDRFEEQGSCATLTLHDGDPRDAGEAIAAALDGLLPAAAASGRGAARRDDVQAHLRRVVASAAGALAADSAAVSLIGPQTVRVLASVGPALPPEDRAACMAGLPEDGVTVILDTWTVRRAPGARTTDGDPTVRFFAAHEIADRAGSPIGSLCVFDGTPRTADEVDIAILRDLAVLAGAEIQHALERTRHDG